MRVFEKVVNKYLKDMVVLEVLSVKISSIRNAKIKEENGKVVVNISDPEAMMDDVVNMTDRCRKENNSCCGPQFFEKMTDSVFFIAYYSANKPSPIGERVVRCTTIHRNHHNVKFSLHPPSSRIVQVFPPFRAL